MVIFIQMALYKQMTDSGYMLMRKAGKFMKGVLSSQAYSKHMQDFYSQTPAGKASIQDSQRRIANAKNAIKTMPSDAINTIKNDVGAVAKGARKLIGK